MKKVINIYKNSNHWLNRPPGIGQFIRGSCYLHEILQPRGVDFKIDISSSKLSYFISDDDEIFSTNKYDSNIKVKEYFAESIRDHGLLVDDLNDFLVNKNLQFHLSTNVGAWDRTDIPVNTKNFIRKLFQFRSEIHQKFKKTIAPADYEVLSVRCGYPQHREIAKLDARGQLDAAVRLIENQILPQIGHPLVISSDSHELKISLMKRYGFLALSHQSTHDGYNDHSEAVAMDMLLLKNSKFTHHINLYADKWSSFSHYISLIHDVPSGHFRLSDVIKNKSPQINNTQRHKSFTAASVVLSKVKENNLLNKIKLNERAKIAVIKPDGIGDLILTTPLLRSLRKKYPLATIVLITANHSLNVTERCPYLDWQIGGMSILTPTETVISIADAVIKRYGKFDLSILARWDIDWYGGAALSVRLGATNRLAFSETCTELKSEKNKGFDQFFTHVIFKKSITHEVENTIEICKYLDLEVDNKSTEVWPTMDDRERVRKLLISRGIGSKFAAICLGASGAVRRLDSKTWFKVCEVVREESGLPIVLLGGAECIEVAEQLCAMVDANNFAGKTSLIESGLLTQAAQFSICFDSSMKHIGAALGAKLIQIVAHAANLPEANSFSQARFGPWGGVCKTLHPTHMEAACRDGFCKATETHCIRNIDYALMRVAIQEYMQN